MCIRDRVILDQTKLPYEVEILSLTDQKDIWNAIYLLQVRGAPAIGVAAGFGVYLADVYKRQVHILAVEALQIGGGHAVGAVNAVLQGLDFAHGHDLAGSLVFLPACLLYTSAGGPAP